jgi:hypothetical protein
VWLVTARSTVPAPAASTANPVVLLVPTVSVVPVEFHSTGGAGSGPAGP